MVDTTDKPVTITDGPLSYAYTLSNLSLHFGRENNRGSEHTIDEQQFPGELQLYAYNSQLYATCSEAKRELNGIAAVSVFIVLAKNSNQANPALKYITNSLKNITRRGKSRRQKERGRFKDAHKVLEDLCERPGSADR